MKMRFRSIALNLLILVGLLTNMAAQGATLYEMNKNSFVMGEPFERVQILPVQNARIPLQAADAILFNLNGDGLRECPVQKTCLGDSCFGRWLDDTSTHRVTGVMLPVALYPICDNLARGKPTPPVTFGVGKEGVAWTMTASPDSEWAGHSNGVNGGISAIYALAVLIRDQGELTKPWGADCGSLCDTNVRAEFKVTASAKTVVTSGDAMQAQFNIRAGIQFENCDVQTHMCVLTLNMKMMCAGGSCADNDTVKAFSDSAQGGMGVFVSYFNDAGSPVTGYIPAVGEQKWQYGVRFGTSLGSATKKGAFCKTDFGIRITWGEFRNVLRRVAAASGLTPLELFGPTWDDRHGIRLISMGAGSETANARSAPPKTATFGGAYHRISVDALGQWN